MHSIGPPTTSPRSSRTSSKRQLVLKIVISYAETLILRGPLQLLSQRHGVLLKCEQRYRGLSMIWRSTDSKEQAPWHMALDDQPFRVWGLSYLLSAAVLIRILDRRAM